MTNSFARRQHRIGQRVLTIGVSVAVALLAIGTGMLPGEQSLTSKLVRSSTPSAPVPDFDGDGASEVFWYAPGNPTHELWRWNGTQFASAPLSVSGTYHQIFLDIEGDGDTDVFWYTPGPGPDHLWRSTDAGFVSSAHPVKGSYLPLVVDHDGDGADEILWYAAGSRPDHLWTWDGRNGFASEPLRINGWYEPLVADFDGSGTEDIFWYGAGSRPDHLWSWDRTGLESRRHTVNGRYEPFTADANGDHADEIVWYAPGRGNDFLWDLSSGSVKSTDLEVNGVYEPQVGDFDGDGRDEVVLYADGPAADHLWQLDKATTTGATLRLPEVGAGFTLRVGDFDGDASADVLFDRRSDGEKVLWWGNERKGLKPASVKEPLVVSAPTTTTTQPPTTTTTAPTTTTNTTRPPTTTTTTRPTTTTTAPTPTPGTWRYPKPAAGSRVDLSGRAGNRISLEFDADQDVTLVLPGAPIESLEVSGGRNITIDGGTVVQRTFHDAAVEFKDFSGELHVRNLHVDPGGRRGIDGDGIRVNSRHAGSIATLQQVRVDAVGGDVDGHHGDIIQTWGGPSVLRVWRLTGYTNYQGLYLAPVHFDWHPPMRTWTFEDVDLHGFGSDGNTLYALSGQGDGDFFSSDNGNGVLRCTNCWAEHPPSGWDRTGGSFAEAGVREGDPGEFVPAR